MDLIDDIPGMSKMAGAGAIALDLLANSGEALVVLAWSLIEMSDFLLPIISTVDTLGVLPESTSTLLVGLVLAALVVRFGIRYFNTAEDNYEDT